MTVAKSINGDEELEFVHPYPHPGYPGYFRVPGYPHFAVSEDGDVIKANTGNKPKVGLTYKGYPVVTINDWKQRKIRSANIHRLVALTFIGRPKRHWDVSLDELTVNHIDGVKTNNAQSNLEWVTAEENFEHARQNSLTGNGRVLARDVRTNEIRAFSSAEAAARYFGIGSSSMSRFMLDGRASTMPHEWHVLKMDDGSDWPEVPHENRRRYCLPVRTGIWAATHVASGKTYYHETLVTLLSSLNLSPEAYNSLRSNSTYYGTGERVHKSGYRIKFFESIEDFKGFFTSKGDESPKEVSS